MRVTLNYCTIADVQQVAPKKGDNQKKDRIVLLNIDEEDFFEMLDHVNPKNIIKYLDMRKIPRVSKDNYRCHHQQEHTDSPYQVT